MEHNSDDEGVLKRTMMGRCALASITKDTDGRTLYGCKECPVQHHDKELLEHHLYMHYNEFRFLCGICGVGLKRREHLERHTQGHLEVRPHACPECGKAFKRKEHLNIHRSIHSGNKDMNCAICNKAFYRKDHLQKHLQTHNKLFVKGLNEGELLNVKQEPTEPIETIDNIDSIEYDEKMSIPVNIPVDYDEKEILPEEAASDDDFKMEIDESYIIPESIEVTVTKTKSMGSSARPYGCTICNKTYKRRDHLKLHSLTHMKKENGCDECGKAFHSPELLLEHVSRVHPTDYTNGAGEAVEDPLLIPSIGHSIIGSQLGPEFVQHIADVPRPPRPPPDDRPHECEICHRKFKRRQHLKVHANVHLKMEPTVWCSLCHAGFYHNQQFEDHVCPGLNPEVSMDEPELAPEQTNYTLDARKENSHPSDFIEVVAIEENIKIVDETRLGLEPEETNIPTPLRVFVCKYCSKPFKRKDHYRIHLHIHTGVKSFFCPYCQKGFYRKDHMKKHALVHEKPKPPVKPKPKKQIPDLYPIDMLPRKDVKPEITIHAPSSTKLRVPLSIKVPYKMVMSLDNGEQHAVTVDPHADRQRYNTILTE